MCCVFIVLFFVVCIWLCVSLSCAVVRCWSCLKCVCCVCIVLFCCLYYTFSSVFVVCIWLCESLSCAVVRCRLCAKCVCVLCMYSSVFRCLLWFCVFLSCASASQDLIRLTIMNDPNSTLAHPRSNKFDRAMRHALLPHPTHAHLLNPRASTPYVPLKIRVSATPNLDASVSGILPHSHALIHTLG